MLLSLGQLVQQSQSAWGDQAAALAALVDQKQWAQVVVASGELAGRAVKAHAIPVATASVLVQAAAKSMAEDKDASEALERALKSLVVAARREDDSTIPDRIRNEELLDRRMDEFERSFGEWQRDHSGFMAIWDRIRGGADLTPFKKTLDDIGHQIELVPLTVEGRQRLIERHGRLTAGLKPGDWKVLVATGVGALVLNAVLSNAGGLAAKGAVVVAKKARKKKSAAKRAADDRPKKKRRKRKSEED